MDKSGKNDVKQGMEETAKSIDRVIKSVEEWGKKEDAINATLDTHIKKLEAAKNGLSIYMDNVKKSEQSIENLKSKGKETTWAEQALNQNIEGVKRYTQQVSEQEAAITSLNDELKKIVEAKEEQAEADKIAAKEMKNLANFVGISERELKKLSAEELAVARNAYEAQKQIDKFNKELQQTERRVTDLRQTAESFERVSRGLFLAGSAIVGTIFASANSEAQRIKDAGGVVDATTQKWLNSQERIQRSYQRIGRTAMNVFLPVLEDVAALAEKGSKFVERHPDLVRAALNTGMIVATVGAVGMLVSKGVRFFADVTLIAAQVKYAASTFMFKQSVDKFLLATTSQKLPMGGTDWRSWGNVFKAGGAGAGGAAAGGSVTAIAGTVAAVLAVIAAGAIIGTIVYDLLAKKFNLTRVNQFATVGANFGGQAVGKVAQAFGMSPEEAQRKTDVFTKLVGVWTGAMEGTKPTLSELIKNILGLNESLDDLSVNADAAQKDLEGARIIANLERENIEARHEYNVARNKVEVEANKSLREAASDLAKTKARINASLSTTLSKLSADFAKSNLDAYQSYQQESAKITSDGKEEILRIEKDKQEQLLKLSEDFAEEKDQLTRDRDALGLVKAQREYEKNKQEIEANADEQAKERRKETQKQLTELRQQYQRERAERFAKYKQDIADAKAQAAQERASAQEQYAQRIAQINQAKQQELAELLRAYNEERKRRILAAYDQIKDLGGALNAERLMRNRYYGYILADTNAFMTQYNATLKAMGTKTATSTAFSGTSVQGGTAVKGTRHSGGSVDDGLYLLKRGEYVLSPSTVQTAQGLIGSQFSQQALLSSLAIGKRNSMTINDQRRFDSRVSPQERREIANETIAEVKKMFEMIGA